MPDRRLQRTRDAFPAGYQFGDAYLAASIRPSRPSSGLAMVTCDPIARERVQTWLSGRLDSDRHDLPHAQSVDDID